MEAFAKKKKVTLQLINGRVCLCSVEKNLLN